MSTLSETEIPFYKCQGAGNDFLIFSEPHTEIESDVERLAPRLCDRKSGVGADGIIFLTSSSLADIKMSYYNADGTRAVCGNGMRAASCLAKQIEIIDTIGNKFSIETDDGVFSGKFLEARDKLSLQMRSPVFDWREIPTSEEFFEGKVRLSLDEREFEVYPLGMGNPHAVVFFDELSRSEFLSFAPELEVHSFFSKKTNVEFVKVKSEQVAEVLVWERGVGETLACGTGACAVAVAAIRSGRMREKG